jgi:ATP synthase proteolipid subunit
MGVLKPDLIMKSVIPVVMAGILGIYGMIVAVILQGKGTELKLFLVSSATGAKQGYAFLAGGLCCGLSSLVSKILKLTNRLLDLQLVSWETRVLEPTRNKTGYSSE